MRRAIMSIALMSAMVAGVVGFASPSGALGVVDLATTVSSDPGAVSPAGESVRYTVTYSNTPDSVLATGATASNETTGGGTLSYVDGDTDGCVIPAAGTLNPVLTCTFDLAPGETRTLAVVVETPSTPGVVTNASTITTNPNVLDVIPDVNTANNTAQVATPVTNSEPAVGSSAFLGLWDSLAFKNHVMTVIATYGSANGVVARMSDAVVTAGTMCGDNPCGTEGLHYEFDEGDFEPEYEAYAGRVSIDVDFTDDNPCYGLGADRCNALYYRLNALDDPQPVLSCDDVPGDSVAPCLVRIYKVGANFHYVVEANTNDPDLIPIRITPLSG